MSLGHCVITWLGPGAGVPAGHRTISIQHQRLHRGMPCDMGLRKTVWYGLNALKYGTLLEGLVG